MVDQSQKCELIELFRTTPSSTVLNAMGIFLELVMKFTRSAKVCGAALLASLLFTPAAFADSGFFVGGSVGNAALSFKDVDFGSSGFDDADSAYKGFVGYIVDLPVVDFGVEVAYVDFGAPADTSIFDEENQIEATGLSGFATLGMDWGLFGVFVKAGVVQWDAEFSLDNVSLGKDDGSDSAYGLGFRFNFSSVEVRAEYEQFDIEDADLDMASVGVLWRF